MADSRYFLEFVLPVQSRTVGGCHCCLRSPRATHVAVVAGACTSLRHFSFSLSTCRTQVVCVLRRKLSWVEWDEFHSRAVCKFTVMLYVHTHDVSIFMLFFYIRDRALTRFSEKLLLRLESILRAQSRNMDSEVASYRRVGCDDSCRAAHLTRGIRG